MTNKERIVNNIAELRSAIEDGILQEKEILEELIEIELQIQNHL